MKNFELTRRNLLGSLGAIGVASAGAGAGTWAYFQDSESSSGNAVTAGTADLNIHNGGSLYYTGLQFTPGKRDSDNTVSKSLNLYNPETLALDHIDIHFEGFTTIEDNNGRLQEDGVDDDGDGVTNDVDDDENFETTPGPSSDEDTTSPDGMEKWIAVERLTYSWTNESDGSTESILLVDESGTNASHNGVSISDKNGNDVVDLEDLAHPDNQPALNGHVAPDSGSGPSVIGLNESGETEIELKVWLHSGVTDDFQGDALQHDITFELEQSGQ